MRVKWQISGFAHGRRKSAPMLHVEFTSANSDPYFATLHTLHFASTNPCENKESAAVCYRIVPRHWLLLTNKGSIIKLLLGIHSVQLFLQRDSAWVSEPLTLKHEVSPRMCRWWEAEKHPSPSVSLPVSPSLHFFICPDVSAFTWSPCVRQKCPPLTQRGWQLTGSGAEGSRDGTRTTQLMHLSHSLSLSVLPLQPEILIEPLEPPPLHIKH